MSEEIMNKITAILECSYTPLGIMQWWNRPVRKLEGMTPQEAWDVGMWFAVLEWAEELECMGAT